MSGFIHIRNWDRFQHADTTRNKNTAAPWIKDHTSQLHDDDWMNLSQSQCGILQGLRLMYAARRGRGVSEAQAKHMLCRSAAEARHWRSNIEALNHAGLVTLSASDLLAERLQPARLDVDVDKEPLSFSPPEKPAEKKKPGSVSPIRKPREADPLWDAMVAAFDAGEFTDSSRGVMNRAVGELRKVGATPQQVGDRKRAYEKKFPDIACTPPALVKHWPYLNGARPAPTTAAERYRQEHERREAH